MKGIEEVATEKVGSIEDIEFLMRTELLRVTPDRFKKTLMRSLRPEHIPSGERFITQGEEGERLYLIQRGACVVSLHKNGQVHPIARLKAGDIVGEMAVLTGEKRSANVDAESPMTVWALDKIHFDRICEDFPGLREFVTDIATERLCAQKITAERTIGKYTINDIIEEGGWSIVYKGVHTHLGFPVAVKMLKHNMAIDSDFFDRFLNEAKVIAGLNHENIVRVYDIESVYRTLFIVMEYLEGMTVKHILDKQPGLPVVTILEILFQVCAGLHYAHQRGIVHQDVKPGNIFIQRDYRIKLVDFGVACPIGGCSHELPGTPYYMAPEQIEIEPVDARTDVYSLGIAAFEMATGRRPFPDDVCEVMRAHITQQTPDPRRFVADLPKKFADFVSKATQKDPSARYQDMMEVVEDLKPLARKLGARSHIESHGKRRIVNLFMAYEDTRQLDLKRLLEEFSERVRSLGGEIRMAEFDDF